MLVTPHDKILTCQFSKGDSLSEEAPITFSYYKSVPMDSSFVFQDQLHFSIADNAPEWIGKGGLISRIDHINAYLGLGQMCASIASLKQT